MRTPGTKAPISEAQSPIVQEELIRNTRRIPRRPRRESCTKTIFCTTGDTKYRIFVRFMALHPICWKLQLSRFEAKRRSQPLELIDRECDVHPVWLGRYPMLGGW